MKLRDRPVAFCLGFLIGTTIFFIFNFQLSVLKQSDWRSGFSESDSQEVNSSRSEENQSQQIEKDYFEDVAKVLEIVTEIQNKQIKSQNLTFEKLDKNKKTLSEIHSLPLLENATSFQKFQLQINEQSLYTEGSAVIDELLHDMANIQFQSLYMKEGGTQLKLMIDFPGGGQAMFKPMRFARNQSETWPNHFYFSDFERHTGEIAAFHLDRLLGFRRAPPVVGRKVNLATDIQNLAPSELLKTFFISPIGNVCFTGKCSYYCDTGHAFCGTPEMSEGSLAAFLPSKDIAERSSIRHPWRRSYSRRKFAIWESDKHFCKSVRETSPYNKGRPMLDLMDMAIFDFLMGNMDRHHYETFKIFADKTYAIHLDHGRGFGKIQRDELDILAPLYQCCMIRGSTLKTLLDFQKGDVSLGEALQKSLSVDPVSPVLVDQHYSALDRRVGIILETIRDCLKSNDHSKVIFISDKLYHNEIVNGTHFVEEVFDATTYSKP